MRRRSLLSVPYKKYTGPVLTDAFVHYPFKGDLLDYSGNKRNIVTKTSVKIYSDHIYAGNDGYCELPFYLKSSINKTVSISFSYSGRPTYRQSLWGRVGDYTRNWPLYANMIRILHKSDNNCVAFFTDGEVLDIPEDPFNIGVNNITITKGSSKVCVYINGQLRYSCDKEADNYTYGTNYKPFIGGVSSKGIVNDSGPCDIYGFAYYEKELNSTEVSNVAKTLGYDA